MIHAGICSITLAALSVEEALDVACRGGLAGIEWWGKDHVPPGDTRAAERAGARTRAAGLAVTSYGSYYRAGVSAAEGLAFDTVLDTAAALGAPWIRIWAGNRNGSEADETHWQGVIDDTLRIADRAAARGIALTFEFHGGTLTDRNATAIHWRTARIAGRPIWPRPGQPAATIGPCWNSSATMRRSRRWRTPGPCGV